MGFILCTSMLQDQCSIHNSPLVLFICMYLFYTYLYFCLQVFESLGEVWAGQITSTVHWLVVNPETELRLAGLRAMAILVGFPGVVASPGGLALLRATVEAACDLLTQRDANVNRDRLLASWALSNVSSVFELYRCVCLCVCLVVTQEKSYIYSVPTVSTFV